MKALAQMTPDEVQAARQQILTSIGVQHPKALEKLRALKPTKPIESAEVADSIHEAATDLENQQKALHLIGLNIQGHLT